MTGKQLYKTLGALTPGGLDADIYARIPNDDKTFGDGADVSFRIDVVTLNDKGSLILLEQLDEKPASDGN